MVASHHWPLDQAHEPSVRTCGSSRTEQDYYRNDESSRLFTLETCCGYGYGPDENYTISLGFSRANRGAPDTARDAGFYENSVPISGRADSRDTKLLQRKDNSSPGPPSTSPSSVALPHLVPKDLSPCPGWGILTPFPFGRQRDKHEHVFAFRRRLARNGFLRSLRTDCPMLNCFSHGTLLQLQPQKAPIWSICYYPQDLPPGRLQGAHPGPFQGHPHRGPLLPHWGPFKTPTGKARRRAPERGPKGGKGVFKF
ncbi:hypothetical protein JTE90_007611 [Oedothorax gibbosus]|uniref:Uncharacterized protein n=1 Tax=Oedothorax gibbosus TaxID=931172 RepID=A0AAV6THQ4_9ARAC|nr:hypothetical protein JTE90_007611 [Oedothorax gibbosus]